MADATVQFKSGSMPTSTPAAGGNPTPTTLTSIAPAGARSISDLMAGFQQPSILSEDGRKYIDTIADALTSAGHPAKVTPVTGSGYEARIITVNHKHFVYLMAETYTGDDRLPVAMCFDDLKNNMAIKELDITQIVQFYVVDKPDYSKVALMATWVINSIRSASSPDVAEMTAQAFANENLVVSTNVAEVMQFVQSTWPLKTTPRCDSGLILYAIRNTKRIGADGRPEIERKPLLAVTGYTEFNRTTTDVFSSSSKITPVYVVTGIHSRIVDPRMTVLGITLASHVMVRMQNWIAPYSRFGKNDPNLGNLFADANGQMCTVRDIVGRNTILSQGFTSTVPFLAFDVQLGAPTAPMMGDLVANSGKLATTIDKFTGGRTATSSGFSPVQLTMYRYDGTVAIGSEEKDSRTVDYLHLVGSHGVDMNAASVYLESYIEPKSRAEAIRSYYTNTKFLYFTNRLIIHPQWADGVARDISNNLRFRIDGDAGINTVDMTALINFAAGNGAQFQYAQPTGNQFAGGWML